jgi:hypothetical protein
MEIKLTNPKKLPSTDLRIVRQSCLKCAVEYSKDKPLTEKGVLEVAERFVKWVFSEVKNE